MHVRLGIGIRQLPCMQAAARARDQPTRASHGRRQLGSGDRRRGARSARPGPQSPTCAGDRVARRPGRETIERCMGRTRTTETATRGRSMARSRGFPNHCRARQPCVRVAPPRPRSIPVRFTLQSANKLLPAPADGDPSSTSSSSSFFALHPAGLFRRTTRSITTPTTTPGNISVHAQLAVLCTAPARANVAGLVMHANARALVHLRSRQHQSRPFAEC